MTETEIAWLAGILEGEGYFGLEPRKYGTAVRPVVGVCMADFDIIERVAMLTGSLITSRPPGRPHYKKQYRVRIRGKRAQAVTRAIRPYLGERRGRRADEILAVKLAD